MYDELHDYNAEHIFLILCYYYFYEYFCVIDDMGDLYDIGMSKNDSK